MYFWSRLCHAFPETYSPLSAPEDKPDENSMDIIPANEKNADHFKDIKQCKSLRLIAIHTQRLIVLGWSILTPETLTHHCISYFVLYMFQCVKWNSYFLLQLFSWDVMMFNRVLSVTVITIGFIMTLWFCIHISNNWPNSMVHKPKFIWGYVSVSQGCWNQVLGGSKQQKFILS